MHDIELKKGIISDNEKGILICKLCGALVADGTIYKQKKFWNYRYYNSYYFELTDEWKESVKLVQLWVERAIGKKGSIKPHKGSFRFRIGNRKLVEYFNSLGIPYGKKASIVTMPKPILMKSEKYQIAFITGALIFDGTVKLDGTVEYTTKSKKLREQMVRILKKNKLHVWKFKKRIERWSTDWKYGFSSRSFNFFLKILEGPKKQKLELIRIGKRVSLGELLKLFPLQEHSKIPFIREIYNKLNKSKKPIDFKELKNFIESKHGRKVHRNTILIYLNLLIKSKLIKRIERGWYTIDSK